MVRNNAEWQAAGNTHLLQVLGMTEWAADFKDNGGDIITIIRTAYRIDTLTFRASFFENMKAHSKLGDS